MTGKIQLKLKSRKGESLTETLAALVISAVSISMLVTMISASTKMISGSIKKMDEYYDAENQIVQQQVSGADSGGEVTVTLHNAASANPEALKLDASDEDAAVSIGIYRNGALKNTVYSYNVTGSSSGTE